MWDYHVVLFALSDAGAQVWDVDSTLGFPVAMDRWIAATFPHEVPADLEPRFRVLFYEDFEQHFSSDRSHMRRSDGSWQAPPPPWPLIRAGAEPMTLMRFVDMESDYVGEVLDLAGLVKRFVRSSP